jgi:hypothetical protein
MLALCFHCPRSLAFLWPASRIQHIPLVASPSGGYRRRLSRGSGGALVNESELTNVTASLSHEGSSADASGSDIRWDNSNDELMMSDSDSMKKAKVITATAAIGMTFHFDSSTIGKDRIQTMEGLSYFVKGSAQTSSSETMPKTRIDEALVFKDFFAVGIRMPPHSVLVDIL